MRLLLVEDDEIFAQNLKEKMTQYYVVDHAQDGEEGWDYTKIFTYDIIVLDVSLPKLNGIDLCKRLRRQDYNGPILLLTAKANSESKVEGLDAGADDYVVKPCSVEELLARLRALLRRQSDSASPMLCWGKLRLNPSSCEVFYDQMLLSLSPKEYNLLELFLRHPRRVFSRNAILEHLWSFEDPPGEETVRAHIKGLRRKLKQGGSEDIIKTIYGLGYCLKEKPSLPATMEEQLQVSWEKYRKPIFERLQTLEKVQVALQQGSLSQDLYQQGEQQAHKLAGSLGMFGFHEGSNIAHKLENWFNTVGTKTASPSTEEMEELNTLITSLHQELQEPESTNSISEPSEIVNYDLSIQQPLILLVDDDQQLVEQLQQEASNWSMQIKVATTILEAQNAIAQKLPDAVLLDLHFPDGPRKGLELLEILTTQFPNLPVLVFTVKDGFNDRMAVVQKGGQAFLSKPLSPALVFSTIQESLQKKRQQLSRVLAVDDDPLILAKLQEILVPWGIEIITLSEPQQFWQTLEKTSPDLLILDVDMPKINGIKICQVVRNDPNWNSLPILFLSAHQDVETIHRIYQAGADDYISKPINTPELITRIFNRLERYRLFKKLYEIDNLTGVANYHHSIQILHRYLRRSQRYHQPLCLGLIELQGFKTLNEKYGHYFGDQVLRKFGYLLRNNFQGEDLVSRWGGVEFVIGMYGLRRQDGVKRIQHLLHQAQKNIIAPDQSHPITFCAEVVERGMTEDTLEGLYHQAKVSLKKRQSLNLS